MSATTARPTSKLQQALTAANLYYLQDLTMEAIARELHTSRSSVSRLLSHARATGLVDIRIHSPAESLGGLAEEVRARCSVIPHIVPMPDYTTEVDRLERVALTAGRLLGRFVDSHSVVGVAWGSTVSAVSRHLVPKHLAGVEIVQLNGAGNTRTTGIGYASEILRRFAGAYGAQVQQFPVPAFFDDPATREALWRERSTKRVLEVQDRVDVAVFSVGAPEADVPGHVYAGGYLEPDDRASLDRDGVVGDVATVFYRADGSWRDIGLNARASGPDLDRLRRAPRRICIAAGTSKTGALHGALAGGLVTDLIVDEAAARALVG